MQAPRTRVVVLPRGEENLERATGLSFLCRVEPGPLLAHHFPEYRWGGKRYPHQDYKQYWGQHALEEVPNMPWACWLELAEVAVGRYPKPCSQRVEAHFSSRREQLERALAQALEALSAIEVNLPPMALVSEDDQYRNRAKELEMDPARALSLLTYSQPPLYHIRRMPQLPPEKGWIWSLEAYRLTGVRA